MPTIHYTKRGFYRSRGLAPNICAQKHKNNKTQKGQPGNSKTNFNKTSPANSTYKHIENRTTSLVHSQTYNYSCRDPHSHISSCLANQCLSSSLSHPASHHINQQLANHQSNAANSQQARLIYNLICVHQPKRIDNLRQGYLIRQEGSLRSSHLKKQYTTSPLSSTTTT